MKLFSVMIMGLVVIGFTVLGCSQQPSRQADAAATQSHSSRKTK
jgi:hypothetical protein